MGTVEAGVSDERAIRARVERAGLDWDEVIGAPGWWGPEEVAECTASSWWAGNRSANKIPVEVEIDGDRSHWMVEVEVEFRYQARRVVGL